MQNSKFKSYLGLGIVISSLVSTAVLADIGIIYEKEDGSLVASSFYHDVDAGKVVQKICQTFTLHPTRNCRSDKDWNAHSIDLKIERSVYLSNGDYSYDKYLEHLADNLGLRGPLPAQIATQTELTDYERLLQEKLANPDLSQTSRSELQDKLRETQAALNNAPPFNEPRGVFLRIREKLEEGSDWVVLDTERVKDSYNGDTGPIDIFLYSLILSGKPLFNLTYDLKDTVPTELRSEANQKMYYDYFKKAFEAQDSARLKAEDFSRLAWRRGYCGTLQFYSSKKFDDKGTYSFSTEIFAKAGPVPTADKGTSYFGFAVRKNGLWNTLFYAFLKVSPEQVASPYKSEDSGALDPMDSSSIFTKNEYVDVKKTTADEYVAYFKRDFSTFQNNHLKSTSNEHIYCLFHKDGGLPSLL